MQELFVLFTFLAAAGYLVNKFVWSAIVSKKRKTVGTLDGQDPSRVSLHRLTERSATPYKVRKLCKATDSVHDFSPVTSSAQKLY